MGTWKLALMPLEDPDHLYFIKNSGQLFVCKDDNKSVVVTTEDNLFDSEFEEKYEVQKIQNNNLVDLKSDLTYTVEKLQKKFTVDRHPKFGFSHIFEEEVYESADAVNAAIDFGQKFISNHQVYLGGFEKNKEELKLIQNLMIGALGSSKIAAEYGCYIMKQLKCFNTVKVFDGHDLKEGDF